MPFVLKHWISTEDARGYAICFGTFNKHKEAKGYVICFGTFYKHGRSQRFDLELAVEMMRSAGHLTLNLPCRS